MMKAIPSKASVELKRRVTLAMFCFLFGMLCYLWVQFDQAASQEHYVLEIAFAIGIKLSALAGLYFFVRGCLVFGWPGKFAKASGAWDVIAARALEEHFPETRVTLSGKEKWLVTDKVSGKTKVEIRGCEALGELLAEKSGDSSFVDHSGSGAKITQLSQFRR